MRGILTIELKGFQVMIDTLTHRMESVNLQSDNIRAFIIKLNNSMLEEISKRQPCANSPFRMGGDTWFLEFADVEKAINFALHYMALSREKVIKNGLFYFKPVVSVSAGNPKTLGASVLDNNSIETYRIADSGEPLTIYLTQFARDNLSITKYPTQKDAKGNFILDSVNIGIEECVEQDHTLTSYMLDTSILVKNKIEDIISYFIAEQNQSEETYVFGGAVPYLDKTYEEYLKSIVDLVKSGKCKSSVLTCISPDEQTNYFWLKFCERLTQINSGKNFNFKFVDYRNGAIPISYHLYSTGLVHFGYRSYSPIKDKRAISSSLMIKNPHLYKSLKDEFLYNFQHATESKKIIEKINKISSSIKTQIDKKVGDYFE